MPLRAMLLLVGLRPVMPLPAGLHPARSLRVMLLPVGLRPVTSLPAGQPPGMSLRAMLLVELGPVIPVHVHVRSARVDFAAFQSAVQAGPQFADETTRCGAADIERVTAVVGGHSERLAP